MVIETIFFVVIAFAIFVYIFLKMIKSIDISYIIVLVLETIGIALNFLEIQQKFMKAMILFLINIVLV